MHPEAFAWVAIQVQERGPFADVVEFGSRDVNGSVRCLFPLTTYVGIDIAAGPGVDRVGNAADYRTPVGHPGHDLCLCLETLEHTPDGARIVEAAWAALKPGGRIMFTMATDPRAPHSAADGGPLRGGEFYANVSEEAVKEWLSDWDDVDIQVHVNRGDLYVTAVRPA